MGDKQNTDQELASFVRQARSYLKYIEHPVWSASEDLTDEHRSFEAYRLLCSERLNAELPVLTAMHSIRNGETGETLATIGITPEAAERARFLTCLLSALPRLLECIEAMNASEGDLKSRIDELLQSNNQKLMENRAQRQLIAELKGQIDFLLNAVPPGEVA